ncbi:MAG TPA: efflux transporter outer membrane subunit, partial [Polyangiaceae bacterium]|nr:efflux transporter outer membrane subunit [Polyangiaceae bacterium]
EARATYGISKADLYPKVEAELKGGGLNPSNGSLLHTPENGSGDTTEYAAVSANFSWEIDFFGRIRRASEAQRALLLASEEARRAVAMTLVTDVATAYVELRGLDRGLEVAKNTIKSRQENVEYAKNRFEGHVTHEVDWRQAEAELHRIESYVFDLEKQISLKENELSFLLGRNPGDILRNRSAEDQPIPPAVPAGLPAALLERRPDVRKAEAELMSATARIGEAKAMLYPRISLTASYGLASTDLSNLVDAQSQTWNIFAGLLQPIFEAGKNLARVEVRESQQRQAVYAYERTLLQALREVEDSLITLRKTGEQRGAQGARLVAERQVLELSELRYKGGVSSYLEVLDSQRSLFNAEIDDLASATEHSRSLIRLYKALGGGWPAEHAAAPPGEGAAPPGEGAAPAEPVAVQTAQ